MITFFVYLIILLPLLYFIGKWVVAQWRKAEYDDTDDWMQEILHRSAQIDNLHDQCSEVKIKEIKKQKQKLNKLDEI